jgi:hypothetical protein
MMSTILDCSRCGKEYKYSEIDEHECADVVVLRARIALLEKVAEAAKRMAERPSDVAKLIDLRAALDAAKEG